MKKVGLIGFGSFGQFAVKYLTPYCEITVYDKNDVTKAAVDLKVKVGTLEEVLDNEIVILGAPVPVFEESLEEIRNHIKDGTVFVDVCSVKSGPCALMEEYIPDTCEIIGTHPLFGPKSGKDGIDGLKIAVCNIRCDSEKFDGLKSFLGQELGLEVIECTPEEHDRQMAYVQGLSHFVGRALSEMDMPELSLTTRAFEHLMGIRDLLSLDSKELYFAIQNDNPFAESARKEFLEKLEELDKF